MNSKAIRKLERIVQQWRTAVEQRERTERREQRIQKMIAGMMPVHTPAINPAGWDSVDGIALPPLPDCMRPV